MAIISRAAPAAPAQTAGVTGRASRQTRGTPPRVSPMNRLYMTQRCSITRLRIGPASSRIARPAAPPTAPSSAMDRGWNRNVVTSAMAAMNAG